MTKRQNETDLDYANRMIGELQDRCDNMQKSIEGLVIRVGVAEDRASKMESCMHSQLALAMM